MKVGIEEIKPRPRSYQVQTSLVCTVQGGDPAVWAKQSHIPPFLWPVAAPQVDITDADLDVVHDALHQFIHETFLRCRAARRERHEGQNKLYFTLYEGRRQFY